MRRSIIATLAAAAMAGPALLAIPASATTNGCVTRDSGHCGGLITHADVRLELAVSGDVHTAGPGRELIAALPAIARAQDWDIQPAEADPSFVVIRWAPFGHPTTLCVTATHDLPGFFLRLETCTQGAAGFSHQEWHAFAAPGGGKIYQNLANNLVMAAKADTAGAPVITRVIGNGTGPNKRWSFRHTAP